MDITSFNKQSQKSENTKRISKINAQVPIISVTHILLLSEIFLIKNRF